MKDKPIKVIIHNSKNIQKTVLDKILDTKYKCLKGYLDSLGISNTEKVTILESMIDE